MKKGTMGAMVGLVLFVFGTVWLVVQPKPMTAAVEICPAAHNFTKILPDELKTSGLLDEVNDKVSKETFCSFSYEKGYVTVKEERTSAELVLVGETRELTFICQEKKVTPFFQQTGDLLLTKDKLFLFYEPDWLITILLMIGWAIVSGLLGSVTSKI